MATVECPYCQMPLNIGSELLGTAVRCPNPQCGRRFTAATAPTAVAPAAGPGTARVTALTPAQMAGQAPPGRAPLGYASGAPPSVRVPTSDDMPFAAVDDSILPHGPGSIKPITLPLEDSRGGQSQSQNPSRGLPEEGSRSGNRSTSAGGSSSAPRSPAAPASPAVPAPPAAPASPAGVAGDPRSTTRARALNKDTLKAGPPADREASQISRGRLVLAKPKHRPLSIPLLTSLIAAFYIGGLAGTLRYSLAMPMIFPLLAGAAVGWAVAFGAGGRGSVPRKRLMAMAGIFASGAALWSWLCLYMWVNGDVYSYIRQKMPVFTATKDSETRLASALSIWGGRAFDFGTFLQLRSARYDIEGKGGQRDVLQRFLFQDAQNQPDGLCYLVGGKGLKKWASENDVYRAAPENDGFGASRRAFEVWTLDSFMIKIKGDSRYDGGLLEPKGGLFNAMLALEIVFAGLLGVLVYLHLVGQGAARYEEADVGDEGSAATLDAASGSSPPAAAAEPRKK